MKINFVTTNKLKFEIAQAFFDELSGDYRLVQCSIDTPEIQDESVVEIAKQSALWSAREIGQPCIKMDVGFFINALNGFPGPFVKYVNDWLTQENILKMMEESTDRSAYFEDALALAYPDGSAEVFVRKTHGRLALAMDPVNTKWPANLLFIPEGLNQTLGSMSSKAQNEFWSDGNWPRLVEYLEKV